MKFKLEGALAGIVALAGLLTLPLDSAEARSWRSYAREHGGGYWVDKYVGEDKNGNATYKGSGKASGKGKASSSYEHTYRSQYDPTYDAKTGKGTNSYENKYRTKHDPTYEEKPAKQPRKGGSSANSAGDGAEAPAVKRKPLKQTAGSVSGTSAKEVKTATTVEDDAPADETSAKGADRAASTQAQSELYGPTLSDEFVTASANE
ncbi:MAG: hypothetical protein ACT4N2_05465 [Hyphomicrobium sp.]